MHIGMTEQRLSAVLLSEDLYDLTVLLSAENILGTAAHRYEPVRPETVNFSAPDGFYDCFQLLVIALVTGESRHSLYAVRPESAKSAERLFKAALATDGVVCLFSTVNAYLNEAEIREFCEFSSNFFIYECAVAEYAECYAMLLTQFKQREKMLRDKWLAACEVDVSVEAERLTKGFILEKDLLQLLKGKLRAVVLLIAVSAPKIAPMEYMPLENVLYLRDILTFSCTIDIK